MADGVLLAAEAGADDIQVVGALATVAGVVAASEGAGDTATLTGGEAPVLAAVGNIDATADLIGYVANATLRIEKIFTPGTPGTPGDPGQPWIPAYTSTETTYQCNSVPVYALVPAGSTDSLGLGQPPTAYEVVIVGYTTECGYVTRTIHHPEQPYIPPTPGTPDTPPDFRLGWRDGARAGPYAGNLEYVFKAHPGISGVVTGLTPPSRDAGYGYLEIDYGLHFSGGFVRVMEAGAVRTGFFPYALDDVFTIERRGKFITYRQNSDVLFETTMPDADLAGPLAVDLSMYSGGDSIWDAQVTETPLDGYGEGDADLPALRGFASDVPANYGDADLPALEATGSGRGVNIGDAELPALQGMASNHAVGQAPDQMLPALESYGEAGYLAPGIPNYGEAYLPPLMGGGLLLVGGVGSGDAELPALHALGGDHDFGQAPDQMLPALEALGIQLENPDGVIEAYGPGMAMEAFGTIQQPGEIILTGPGMALEAHGASVLELGGPGMAMEAEGIIHNVGVMLLGGPGMAMEAEGVIHNVGTLELGGPGMALEAHGASVLELTGPGMALEAEGRIHNVGAMLLGGPGMALEAEGVIAISGTLELGGPGMALDAWGGDPGVGVLEIGGPTLYFQASGDVGGAPAPVTYAVNLRAGETTRYESYTFDWLLRLGGQMYGVRPDGLYLLGGDTDGGAQIPAYLRPHPSDFGSQKLKRTPYIYLGTTDPVKVTAYVDGRETGTFAEYHRARRVTLPRGPKGRYWAYRVANVAGGDLRLDGYEPQVELLSRKV